MGTIQNYELWLTEPDPALVTGQELNWRTLNNRFWYAGVVFKDGLPYDMVQHFNTTGDRLNGSWDDTSQTIVNNQEEFRLSASMALADELDPNPSISYIVINAYPAVTEEPHAGVPLQSPHKRRIRAWIDVRSKVDQWGSGGSGWQEATESMGFGHPIALSFDFPQITTDWTIRSALVADFTVPANEALSIDGVVGDYNSKNIYAWMHVGGPDPQGTYHLSHVLFRMEVETFDETPAHRRTFPRDDGLAGGARRNYPPSRAIQSGNRNVGGYL